MRFWVPLWAHAKWIAALREHVYGGKEVDPTVIGRTDQCELGRWLRGEGAQFRHLPAFAEVVAAHESVHRRAVTVVALADAGRRLEAEAETAAGGELRRRSRLLVGALRRLNAQIVGSPEPVSAFSA